MHEYGGAERFNSGHDEAGDMMDSRSTAGPDSPGAPTPGSGDSPPALRVREALPGDAGAWDTFVLKHSDGTAYHRWAYKRSLESAYGIRTVYLLAEGDDGRLAGLLPVARIPGWPGRRAYCSLPYCDLGDALVSTPEAYGALTRQLAAISGTAAELRGSRDPVASDEAGDEQSPADGTKVRMLLALPESSVALFEGFKSKHRSQINKAKKNGLSASVDSGVERVDAFYDVFARNMRDLGSPTHSRSWFRCIAEHYGDDCLIGLVRDGERCIGAGIVLRNGSRAVIPWASTLRTFNHLAPNMLLYWALLERVTDLGCTSFDFGRSSYGEGTFRFKRQWGAQPAPLHWRRLGADGREEPLGESGPAGAGRLRGAVEAIWQRLPLPVTIAVGSRLRPLISL
jgi:FemAB-related protein (PEP-CTERM system-associated)